MQEDERVEARGTISGYLYGTSPKDGLLTHDRSKPVQFDESDVVSWHLSRSYGDARRYLGARLKDGRMVFVVRSQLSREDAARLDKIAKRVRRGTVYAGSPWRVVAVAAGLYPKERPLAEFLE